MPLLGGVGLRAKEKTMRKAYLLPMLLTLSCLMSGCGIGWQMDYGKPAAQFLQEDLSEKGKPYIGQLIEVKGAVTRIDLSDPEAAWVYLGDGIRCNFEKFTAMAESESVGSQVYVRGFLKRCDKGDIVVEPALYCTPDEDHPFRPR
jgi:hypothetical protein